MLYTFINLGSDPLVGTGRSPSVQVVSQSSLNRDIALKIVQRLDMTSFPNLTETRRAAGKRTLADYGFTKVRFTPSGVQVRDVKGLWQLTFDHIVRPGDYWINLCFREQSLSSAARPALAVPLILSLRADGLYGAKLERGFGLPSCPSLYLPPVT